MGGDERRSTLSFSVESLNKNRCTRYSLGKEPHTRITRSHSNLRTIDYDPRNIWSTAVHTALSPTRTDRFREKSPGLLRGKLPYAVPPGSATARRIIRSTCVTFTFLSSKNDFSSTDKRNFYVYIILMRTYDAERFIL